VKEQWLKDKQDDGENEPNQRHQVNPPELHLLVTKATPPIHNTTPTT
jgi:hypothetical protein